jgi:hypothetical protein
MHAWGDDIGIRHAVARIMWKAVLAGVVVAAGGAVAAPPAVLGGMCPMMTEGARVQQVDTPDGAELDFSIDGDPTLLRARVHQMALAHNQMPRRMTITGQGAAAGEAPVISAQAQAQDTSAGARLLLSADDPGQIGELRQQLHDKVADCMARRR